MRTHLLYTLLFLLGVSACSPKETAFLLLHTNDSHGSIFPYDSLGGMARRAALVRSLRDSFPGEVLLLDAGDLNTGQVVSNHFKARPDILAYNYMGYDAATFGNHEFDNPVDTLLMQMRLAHFPFVSSNVGYRGEPLGTPFVIKEVGGIRVGIFGVATSATAHSSTFGSSVEFADEVQSARRAVADLQAAGADFIIGLVHLGLTETASGAITSPELARQVEGIDLLVDGHTHSFITEPLRVGGTCIVTASHSGRYLGCGKLSFRGRRFTGIDWRPLPVGGGIAPDTLLARLLRPYVAAMDSLLHTPLGTAAGDYVTDDGEKNLSRYGETAIGDLVADAMKWQADSLFGRVDFALINGGAIRAGLPAGSVTPGQLLGVLPFDNRLAVVTLRGSALLRLFRFYAALPEGSGAYPQVSREVRACFGGGNRPAASLAVAGQPVDTARLYRFATCDYVASGIEFRGTGLDTCFTSRLSEVRIAEALARYIRACGVVAPATDGRLRRLTNR